MTTRRRLVTYDPIERAEFISEVILAASIAALGVVKHEPTDRKKLFESLHSSIGGSVIDTFGDSDHMVIGERA